MSVQLLLEGSLNIVDYLMSKSVRLAKVRETQFKCNCLFHEERTPSMYVYINEPQHYYCYGCDAHGDLMSLIRHFQFGGRVDRDVWKDVFNYAESHGMTIVDHRPYLPPPNPISRVSSQESLALTIALQHYKADLTDSPEALDYLRKRGIRKPLTLDLGYASGRNFATLAHKLQEALGTLWQPIGVTSGLLWPDGSERLAGRIFIPEIRNQQVVYYQARALDPTVEKRYLNPKHLTRAIIGLETLDWPSSIAVLVEGPFDALPLISVGVPAVAILGSRLAEESLLARRIGNKHIIVATDNDVAGHEIATRMMTLLSAAGISNRRVIPQVGKDVNEWCQKLTPEWVAASIRALNRSTEPMKRPAGYAA
jgi:DNA primase